MLMKAKQDKMLMIAEQDKMLMIAKQDKMLMKAKQDKMLMIAEQDKMLMIAEQDKMLMIAEQDKMLMIAEQDKMLMIAEQDKILPFVVKVVTECHTSFRCSLTVSGRIKQKSTIVFENGIGEYVPQLNIVLLYVIFIMTLILLDLRFNSPLLRVFMGSHDSYYYVYSHLGLFFTMKQLPKQKKCLLGFPD
ncbi:hypothetical protein MAR_003885 [Mya arenaria]|uniref:Uncharacterized protein n=1 Tax=Mya arenaria TaxID=6604 RepID=A0ABY7EWV8_MYAAR|nr:hypothetical protein MAR_003885 [Mya arenaria]